MKLSLKNLITFKKSQSKGQMAIFIALIFQILFVFFAMVINVGLLVHHKINLQNAADIAAYYAASKQAEVLNTIAHTNYQIRQSWKLLSWRYRVLGQLGAWKDSAQIAGHPPTETKWYPGIPPVLCVTHKPIWSNLSSSNENLCKGVYLPGNQVIPPIPIPNLIAFFNPINQAVINLAQTLRQQATQQCQYAGPINWRFLAWTFYGYRQDQANRKMLIRALSQNISGNNFLDIEGNSIEEGTRKTLEKNMTKPNLDNGNYKLKIFNSMSQGTPCSDSNFWLPSINVAPMMLYRDTICGGGGYIFNVKRMDQPPSNYSLHANFMDPNSFFLAQVSGEPSDPTSVYHSSIGVEKNPWCMVYAGVKVSTTPKIPFFPFADGIEITARSFAKPFGGRVGPWYEAQWPNGNSISAGGGKIDKLVSNRLIPGSSPTPNDNTRFPNYSRYVGDVLGLSSYNVLVNMLSVLQTISAEYEFLKDNATNLNSPSSSGDILAWNHNINQPTALRNHEIAAIAPDQFDITYYSIEPNFYNNYYQKLLTNSFLLHNGTRIKIRPDLGSRPNIAELVKYNINRQLFDIVTPNPIYDFNKLFWNVLDRQNLLTGWSQLFPSKYELQENYFGKCYQVPHAELPNPGSCIAGGRTGYSVKIISKDFLISELQLGGMGMGPGLILNSPPEDF